MQIFRHLTANSINLKPFDFHRELSMEAYLIENPNILCLDDENFCEVNIVCDELPLKSARVSKDSDGRIDLLVKYPRVETLGLIELKKGQVGIENIEQLKDYLEQRQQILNSTVVKESCEELKDPKWIGILAGTSITSDLVREIEQGYEIEVDNVKIPLAALTIKRFKSDDGQFFVITDTYFNSSKSDKDMTKFHFNGKEYGKGRLVLAVLKDYTKKHPDINYSDLKSKFPDKLQGTHVFSELELANEVNAKGNVRFFAKPDEVIKLSDETIAISSQWGKGNINKFIEAARKLGIKID